MHAEQVTVHGEDFIGLLGFATDRYAFLSPQFERSDILDVPTLVEKTYSTNLVGLFCLGNSNGILLPYFVSDSELETITRFAKSLGVEVGRIEERYTALGNMIAANDKGAYVSELIRDFKKIEDVLGVEVQLGSVGGHMEVGAYVMAINKGFLAHPDADRQLDEIADILKVKGMIGTVNCGIPFVKSGLIANSNGYLTGGKTTPIEMQRIEDALGLEE
jgi:translation initiation factor 6